MKKSIKDWLETLPEPYRARALDNADVEDLEEEYSCLSDALQEAFSWELTPEGIDFWNMVWKWAEHSRNSPTLPPIPPE